MPGRRPSDVYNALVIVGAIPDAAPAGHFILPLLEAAPAHDALTEVPT